MRRKLKACGPAPAFNGWKVVQLVPFARFARQQGHVFNSRGLQFFCLPPCQDEPALQGTGLQFRAQRV